MERVCPGRVDDCQPRNPVDQPELLEFQKRLAKRARVPEISARNHDPVRRFPVQRLEDAEHDRLLPIEAERIDAVAEIDLLAFADQADLPQRVVEVTGNLERFRAIVERLRELAVGDLAAADEDDRLEQPRAARIDGERGARVARRSTGREFRADHVGMRGRGGHPVVFEAARGVQPFVLEHQPPRFDPHVACDGGRILENRLPFADRDDLVLRSERQEPPEPPHATEIERVIPPRPGRLELAERLRDGQFVPLVGDVEQIAAVRAAGQDFVTAEGRPAIRVDALLEGAVGIGKRRGNDGTCTSNGTSRGSPAPGTAKS